MQAKHYLLFSLLSVARVSYAGDTLLYLEAQAVAGYSSLDGRTVYHSMSAGEPMQKTSAGFDLIKKFSGDRGDTGTLALQGRLAWDKDAKNRLEPQLYNAYYRLKLPSAYLWAGHNRAASGLESYFDTHGALLQTLPMYGYGFDRDWGVGLSRDFQWGSSAISATTGSGMRLRSDGNYLFSARSAYGVLASDNYSAAIYSSYGRTPDISGYTIIDGRDMIYSAFGADAAMLLDRWELRGDLRTGQKRGMKYTAGLARAGLNLMEENRLKLEAQAVYSGMAHMGSWILSSGFSYSATSEVSWRTLFEYDDGMNDKRIITQLYLYLPV